MTASIVETYEVFLSHKAAGVIYHGYYRGVDFYEVIEHLTKDKGKDGQNFERLQHKLILSHYNVNIIAGEIVEELHEMYMLVAVELINSRYTFLDLQDEFYKWCKYR